MCMTLTEISMHEAFFLWRKQKPMFSPSLWSFPRYGHEDKYGVRRHVKQLIAKQSTQKPPEVTGVENGNMFKKQSVMKRDKEKKSYMSSEKECDIWIKTGEKRAWRWPLGRATTNHCGKSCVLWLGWFDWGAAWELCTFFFSSILLIIIYPSSKYTCNIEKGTLFEITDLLNPFFFATI